MRSSKASNKKQRLLLRVLPLQIHNLPTCTETEFTCILRAGTTEWRTPKLPIQKSVDFAPQEFIFPLASLKEPLYIKVHAHGISLGKAVFLLDKSEIDVADEKWVPLMIQNDQGQWIQPAGEDTCLQLKYVVSGPPSDLINRGGKSGKFRPHPPSKKKGEPADTETAATQTSPIITRLFGIPAPPEAPKPARMNRQELYQEWIASQRKQDKVLSKDELDAMVTRLATKENSLNKTVSSTGTSSEGETADNDGNCNPSNMKDGPRINNTLKLTPAQLHAMTERLYTEDVQQRLEKREQAILLMASPTGSGAATTLTLTPQQEHMLTMRMYDDELQKREKHKQERLTEIQNSENKVRPLTPWSAADLVARLCDRSLETKRATVAKLEKQFLIEHQYPKLSPKGVKANVERLYTARLEHQVEHQQKMIEKHYPMQPVAVSRSADQIRKVCSLMHEGKRSTEAQTFCSAQPQKT
eukprot:TRINITY_DN67821_c2_g1_i1.p1 TRINITY_DN67821_c2_g1~~TRINITY_DN67821_c2_g1_i1.p1  ORF type:complete len:470 (-),score=59.49 TRINITY_DN67821_c2_g1_i1:74-1483(-)